MPLTPGPFLNVVGTPVTPQFAELAILGHTLESSGATKPMNMISHWRAIAPAAGGSPLTLATNIAAGLTLAYQNLVTADTVIDSWVVKFMDNPLFPPAAAGAPAAGVVPNDRGPSFNAGVIRKRTGVPRRNYRGSMHVGSVPEDFTTKDQLNVAGLAAYNAFMAIWSGWIVAGVSDGVNAFFPIVLSKTLSNLFVNPSIFTGAAVTSFLLNGKIGTMKRRKEK